MINIKSISQALSLFEEAAIKHARATKQGDYKVGNKNYNLVMRTINYLKEQNSLDSLLKYFTNDDVGIRIAAATFLLPKHEQEATKVLQEVVDSSDFFSFIAKTTLSEWRKGNLKL